MNDIRVNSIADVDLSGLEMPQVAIYREPMGYPGECVARVCDNASPTNVVICRDNVQELMTDIRANTNMMFVARFEEDHPTVVGLFC